MFALVLLLVSAAISLFLIKRTQVLDIPNGRSSHKKPTPTIGGVAIVFTFFLSMIMLYLFAGKTMISERFFLGFTFSALLIAGMSLYDDLKKKPFYIRLATHVIAVLMVMGFGIIIHRVDFPPGLMFLTNRSLGAFGYFVTFWWILGMINAYNFMDGLNGMAGGNAIIAGSFFCIITYTQGSDFAYIVSYTLVAGVAGFLIFNFPRGKLFMGDIGSTFLGFTFGVLPIIASLYDNAHTSLLVLPLLLFHFIYDTSFTFIRRLFKGENVFQAHRTHLYQLFNRLGFTHFKVTVFYWGVAVLQGVGALWMVTIPGPMRLMVFLPYLIFQMIYTIVIIYHARKGGLL
ncbi:UDP-GlcNAc:undecaprenyl-phosphate GlcNAc-1-phosphate transferase [Desulfocicer vacuolatum DSM 3385]|uniref:UDP-GlcNAc:undecaprenyl-phosphate GlcNAc-1-phosphate transferase n=1 Tax=Desulfocicer vacuolatum DSM 3385 TaxID=1121400 RepID=A0A1W2BUZ8_9BACT|nr:UDP-GlcNAc:undecaprenyl-phosphate GlcNAc-1-phosphate transferase [Desulfocicer vacuolatum DSM 3385]